MDQFEIFAAEIDYGTDFLNVMETTRFLSEPDLAWDASQVDFQMRVKLKISKFLSIRKSLKVANLVRC